MRYYKYIIHSYRCVLGFMANGEVQEILNFSLHDSKVFAILRALSGKKVMSGKLQKEMAEMNRETITLFGERKRRL